MGKTRVGIIFGGCSAEHDVSLQSAKNIVDALDKQRFDVALIGIDKQGQWRVSDPQAFLLHAEDPARIALNPWGNAVAVHPGVARQQLVPTHPATALYPTLWAASGLGYTALITRLLELALERHAHERALQSSITTTA